MLHGRLRYQKKNSYVLFVAMIANMVHFMKRNIINLEQMSSSFAWKNKAIKLHQMIVQPKVNSLN